MPTLPTLEIPPCSQTEVNCLSRVNFTPGMLLTAVDMQCEQNYFLEKLRLHNRFLHGWGVVCGLEVTHDPSPEQPFRVCISPGYALGPFGDEIHVPIPLCLNLAECGPETETDPCEPNHLWFRGTANSQLVCVAIKYAECKARPVRAMPPGCGCEEDICEYSRICDSFQLKCLLELPPSHTKENLPTLCQHEKDGSSPPCPPPPTDPWVVLACIQLPTPNTNPTHNLPIASTLVVNNSVRRQIYSTTLLQTQLIKCCCHED